MNIALPHPCFVKELLFTLQSHQALVFPKTEINFTIEEGTYISPASTVFLASWGNHFSNQGVRISFTGETSILNYLSRINLFSSVGYDYTESFNRRASGGRFIPLTRIDCSAAVETAYESVCELIVCQFENAREFLPAVDWAVYELLDNVTAHSESNGCSYLFGQYIKKEKKICISVYDYGIGLQSSLSPYYTKVTNAQIAIELAMARGITSKQNDHLGNGLAGTREICKKNLGRFCLSTGNKMFVETAEDIFYQTIPAIPGTHLILDLRTDKPVDLRSTFIEENEIDYIYRSIAKLGNTGNRIILIDECPDFGSRLTAKRLRQKIEALLPDMNTALILDFESVLSMSSSFADELLGKLYTFNQNNNLFEHIRIENINDACLRRVNVVIKQRVDNKTASTDELNISPEQKITA